MACLYDKLIFKILPLCGFWQGMGGGMEEGKQGRGLQAELGLGQHFYNLSYFILVT